MIGVTLRAGGSERHFIVMMMMMVPSLCLARSHEVGGALARAKSLTVLQVELID